MRRILIGGLIQFVALSAFLFAQAMVTFERVDVTDGPVALAAVTIDPPGEPQIRSCEARLETAQIRYRWDGGTVSATTGMILDVGDALTIGNHGDAEALRFAKTGSTTGVLMVTCWAGGP